MPLDTFQVSSKSELAIANTMNTIAKIRAIVDGITDTKLQSTCYAVLDEPKFAQSPASISHHHAYTGGLAEHTLEVLRYLNAMTVVFPEANTDVLITAAVWHDALKVQEYVPWAPSGFEIPVPQPEWMYTSDGFGRKIGHISAGAMRFHASAEEHRVSPELGAAVAHCILAHHGRREWGSPVEPQTLEALLLHQADMMSANYGQTKEVAL